MINEPSKAQDISEPGSWPGENFDDDDNEFEFEPQNEPWDDETPLQPSFNCHGVVHVHVLCAQRLPCPCGSSISASLSLIPWRGRVRTQRSSSFVLPFENRNNGVCVRWDKVNNLCSMVNAWSSEDSPVPKISCDLLYSPLGVGLLEFTMCSFEISCEPLMKDPGVWKSHWFSANTANANQESSSTGSSLEDNIPAVKLAAVFNPTNPTRSPKTPLPTSPAREAVNTEQVLDADEDGKSSHQSKDRDVIGSVCSPPNISDQTASFTQADVISSTGIETPSDEVLPDGSSNPHLLRVVSSWIPKHCDVCSRIILGRNQVFACELCSVQCCSDCRLHVDLRLPCGSDEARAAAESRHQLSFDNILSVVAPDEGFIQEKKSKRFSDSNSNGATTLAPDGSLNDVDAIGCLSLEFTSACLFQHPLSAYADPCVVFNEKELREVRTGDYYARISIAGSGATSRTQTRQNTGLPKFEASEMQFNVKHYGEEFLFEVVDATTDAVIGATYLTAHCLILDQKNELLSKLGCSILQFTRGAFVWNGKRSMKLLLRRESKGAPSMDIMKSRALSNDSKNNGGIVTGWLEVQVGLEEYVDKLYGKTCIECPARPTPELNLAAFQTHVVRLKHILSEVNKALKTYEYLVSWKDPAVTGLCLAVFTITCIFFDFEYIGCLPFIGPLLLLAYSSYTRDVQGVQKRFISKGIDMFNKMGDTKVCYTLHRPIGTIEITVYKGLRICSRDLGVPGKSLCNVIWDPLRFADEKTKKRISEYDKSAESQHEVGSTDSRFGAEPVWEEIFESDQSRRLMHFLPWDGDYFQSLDRKRRALRFPLLQPLTLKSKGTDSLGRFVDGRLQPWSTCPAAIVLRVRFQDFLNNLPGSDHILGEVVFPFDKLVEAGEVTGWFEVLSAGSNSVSPCLSDDETSQQLSQASQNPSLEPPLVYASFKWFAPRHEDKERAADTEHVASRALQEELIRFATDAKHRKADLLASSIGAVNTALGMGGNLVLIQNYLGMVVDFIEILFNALNFTDPFISSALFFAVSLLFLIFVYVQTRYIVLSLGLVQFGVSYVSRYGSRFVPRSSETRTGISDKPSNGRRQGNASLWVKNAFRSLPTRDDLWKIYAWESKRLLSREQEKQAANARNSRLGSLWKATWFSPLKMRLSKQRTSADQKVWEPAFAVMKGHRFLWWHDVDAFDNGEVPSGMIFFSGHAGLTGPSPVEAMEIDPKEKPLSIVIFGRGSNGQERVVAILPGLVAKQRLEAVVAGLTTKDD